ncbi:MAG: hypothetical protein ABSF81_10020 [Bacteroidales bacterium]|jgi:capsular polysaccharide biosynthesis protein
MSLLLLILAVLFGIMMAVIQLSYKERRLKELDAINEKLRCQIALVINKIKKEEHNFEKADDIKFFIYYQNDFNEILKASVIKSEIPYLDATKLLIKPDYNSGIESYHFNPNQFRACKNKLMWAYV